MTIYSPTAVLSTNYALPDDGDDADAASLNVVLEPLADGIKLCGQNMTAKNDWMPAFDEAWFTSYGSPVTSAAFADVNEIISLPSAVLNDVLQVIVTGYAGSTSANGVIKLALRYGFGSTHDFDQGCAVIHSGSSSEHFTIIGTIILDNTAYFNNGAPSIYMMAKSSVGTVTVCHPIGIRYQLLRSA